MQFRVTNQHGSSMIIGNGDPDAFSPIDLLLAAIAGCTAMDVDAITGKRAEPERYEVDIRADKIKDVGGNRLVNIEIDFRVRSSIPRRVPRQPQCCSSGAQVP